MQSHHLTLNSQDHQQIESLIVQSAQASNEIQKSVYKQIQELNSKPIFLNHLIELYADPSKSSEFRHRTGIILRSAIRQIDLASVGVENMTHLQGVLLGCCTQTHDNKKVTSLLVSTLLTHAGIQKCHLLLQHLVQSLETGTNLNMAVDCLSKMIEDLKYNQENISFYDTSEGIRLMDSLIGKFLALLQQPLHDEEVLCNAINFLNFNVFFMPPSLAQSSKFYLDVLLQCFDCKQTTDSRNSSTRCRLRALQGFQVLVETKRDYMNDHIGEIVKATCALTTDTDKQVRKEAMIFLTDFLRLDDDDFLWQLELLKPQLHFIIPKIVESLQITQDDIINIMPTFESEFKPKDEITGRHNSQHVDEEDINECARGEYTLRKVAGQLIEKICDYYPEEGFRNLSLLLEPLILSQQWKLQEASFLCFGTVATSLTALLTPGLPKLMQYLFEAARAPSLYLRSTAIWSIAQFTSWIQQVAPTEQNFIIKYLELLLTSLDDKEKVVQESACTALNKLASEASFVLNPFIEQILEVYLKALDKEDGGIAIFIYGSLSSVASYSDNIKNPKYAQLLLTRLVQKLEGYQVDNLNICPILECMSIMVEKFEELSLPYCPQIYEKCYTCIQTYIRALQHNDAKLFQEKKQIYMRCLDILSNVVFLMRDAFHARTDFVECILLSLSDTDTDVKQYAASFLGELVKSCPQAVPAHIDKIIQALCQNVYDLDNDPVKTYLSLTNNCVWSLAEISQHYPDKLLAMQPQLLKKLIQLLHTPKLHRHIAQNFAVALARICALQMEVAAPHLGSFFKRICLVLAEAKSEEFVEHKNESFSVLLRLIVMNPLAALSQMVYLMYSFTLFEEASPPNQQLFYKVASDYKNSIPPQEWESQLNSQVLPQGFRAKLKARFNF